MTGISLRLAWHSFRPSPLGVQVQGDIALSVLGWVDAKFTLSIDMGSLVEPPNANPTPLVSSWVTLHRARLVSLLCLFGRFNSVSISAVSVAGVAFSPSYCHVHNIPRLLVRLAARRKNAFMNQPRLIRCHAHLEVIHKGPPHHFLDF